MRIETDKKNGKLWLSGWGDTEAKIMIIVSHPSFDDLRAGELLAPREDESGDTVPRDELENALASADIELDTQCWVTAMVKYGIGSKDKPDKNQIEECAAELDEEIAEVKPKLIIPLGAEAFKRVMKQNIGLSDYVGEIIDSPYGKVMANYSPGQVLRIDPTLRPEFAANFTLAKRFIDDELNYTEYETLVITEPEDNKEIIDYCIENELFSVG